jgi:hypothetical protein
MKNGDVVFFKNAKSGSARNAPEVQFKGMGFGVLLGHVPPFQKDPPPDQLLGMMGQIGFLSFDDVGEFLGNESGAACVAKFEDKYYGKKIEQKEGEEPIQPELPLQPPTPSPIVGMDGAPLQAASPEA